MHFNRSKESNPSVKKSDLIVRMASSVLKNPAAIAGIGTILLAVGLLGLWSREPIFAALTLAGAMGLALALDDLRKKKRGKNRMKPRHVAALFAVAGIFLVTGLVTVWQSAPIPTIMTLVGAAIAAAGARRLLARRSGPRKNSDINRSRGL